MILTVNETKYISENLVVHSNVHLDTSEFTITYGNIDLKVFDQNAYTSVEVKESEVFVTPYTIEITTTLLPNKFYILTLFTIPSSAGEIIYRKNFKFLTLKDRKNEASINNVYTQLKNIDSLTSCENLLKNSEDYSIKFYPSTYNTENKAYETSNELVSINNNEIVLDNLVSQYFTEYKTFYDVINTATAKQTVYDNEYIHNLHLVFMNNMVKWYCLKGNKAYIELMFSLYAKYLGYNILSIVEDPVHNFVYRVSSSLSKKLWTHLIKPYVHPLSWNTLYSEISSDTRSPYYQLLDLRKSMREVWMLDSISYLDAQCYSDQPIAYYKKLGSIYHSSGNIEAYNYTKILYKKYLDYDTTYIDTETGIKYIITIENNIITPKETLMDVYPPVKIIRDVNENVCYYINIKNGNIDIVETEYDATQDKIHFVKDFNNNTMYAMLIKNGTVYICNIDTHTKYLNTNKVYEDIVTGLKYLLTVENDHLKFLETDKPVSTRTKLLKDSVTNKFYNIVASGGNFELVEAPYNFNYCTVHYVKELDKDIIFNLEVINGKAKIHENITYYDKSISATIVSYFYILPYPWHLLSADTLFTDIANFKKYVLVVNNNNTLRFEEILPSYIPSDFNTDNYNSTILNDISNGMAYIINSQNGEVLLTETASSSSYKSIYYLKDYHYNITYKMYIKNGEYILDETFHYNHIHSECSFKNIRDEYRFGIKFSGFKSLVDYERESLYKQLKHIANIKYTIDRYNKTIILDFGFPGVANEYIYEIYNNSKITNIVKSVLSKVIIPIKSNDVILLKLKKNEWEQYINRVDQLAFIQYKPLFEISSKTKYTNIRNDNKRAYQYNSLSVVNFTSEKTNDTLAYTNDFEYLFTDPISGSNFISEFDTNINFNISSSDVMVGSSIYKNTNFKYPKAGIVTKYEWTLYTNNNMIENKTTYHNSVNFMIKDDTFLNSKVGLRIYYKNGSYKLNNLAICI